MTDLYLQQNIDYHIQNVALRNIMRDSMAGDEVARNFIKTTAFEKTNSSRFNKTLEMVNSYKAMMNEDKKMFPL